jgi:hypothetical protein
MCASKISPFGAHKCRPYSKPALTKLTPEEAKGEREAKSIPGDEFCANCMSAKLLFSARRKCRC